MAVPSEINAGFWTRPRARAHRRSRGMARRPTRRYPPRWRSDANAAATPSKQSRIDTCHRLHSTSGVVAEKKAVTVGRQDAAEPVARIAPVLTGRVRHQRIQARERDEVGKEDVR